MGKSRLTSHRVVASRSNLARQIRQDLPWVPRLLLAAVCVVALAEYMPAHLAILAILLADSFAEWVAMFTVKSGTPSSKVVDAPRPSTSRRSRNDPPPVTGDGRVRSGSRVLASTLAYRL